MEPTRTGSQALIKLLAIIGFFAILGLFVWLIVQGVRSFPSAFMSLASIAETVGGYRPQSELTIDMEKNIVNSGETFTMRWTDMGPGSYTFTYMCEPGVVLSVRASDHTLREVPCAEALVLTEEAHGLFVSVNAHEQRFSDVDFKVMFDARKGDTHIATGRVTIVNATVPTRTESEVVQVDIKEPTVSVRNDVPKAITLPPKETLVVPQAQTNPPTPNAAASVVSILPRSYADGFVDLRALYLGVGTIQNGNFVPKATFKKDDTAAFRFEVKNIGTKTSDTWTYKLSLPGDVEYVSESQNGLAPNEKAIFTVGFELGEVVVASVTVGGEVKTQNDNNDSNNDFDWSVKVTN